MAHMSLEFESYVFKGWFTSSAVTNYVKDSGRFSKLMKPWNVAQIKFLQWFIHIRTRGLYSQIKIYSLDYIGPSNPIRVLIQRVFNFYELLWLFSVSSS